MKSIIVISTTFEDKEDAARLAKVLVEGRLVACAQISGPITSIYRWREQIEEATEFTLSMKTIPQRVDAVIEQLTASHPYDVPEIVSRELHDVNREYLEWVYKEIAE
ncbi:MAG: divalent-cation tolerance protein CutA [Desulforhopalus sp.]